MWPFDKKTTLRECGIFQNSVDWHSHILPGVDDGFKTYESSLEALKYLEGLGVRKLWCTPHIMEEMPNTPEDLQRRFEQLKAIYSGPIELHLGSENMMDTLLARRLSSGDVLPIGANGDRLMVEMSCCNPCSRMNEFFREIRSAGFFPVLAHPERYYFFGERDYRRLHDDGVLFQLNILSLAGAYGKTVCRKARWILEQGFYDLRGSDLHSLESLDDFVNEKIKIFKYED